MPLRSISVKEGDTWSVVSREEFVARPLDERLQLILHKRVVFRGDADTEVPLKEGLRVLREMTGGRSAAPPPAGGDGSRLMPLKDFLALPLNERVSLVLERRVRLENELGQEISTREAVKGARGAGA